TTAVAVPVDPRVATLSLTADPAALMGLSYTAHGCMQCALEAAQRSNAPADRAWAEPMAAGTSAILRDPPATIAHAVRPLDVCAEESNPVHEAAAKMVLGWAQAETGKAEIGLATVRAGLEAYLATGQRRSLELFLGLLADTLVRSDNATEALRVLADA